ncbi:MAG: hypothetical protein J6R28_04670 [Bacteroides sp.]|nr:hypothetical protein [Bacteroides sp.]
MKYLRFLIPLFLVACKGNDYTLENSQFIGKLAPNDTLIIINKFNDCETGPYTATYKIYYINQSNNLRCDYLRESGWSEIIENREPIVAREYNISKKALKAYLRFEKDVINKATNKYDSIFCTFYEFYDIVLKNDTASSSHEDCHYDGFGKFNIILKGNIISETWFNR